MQRIKVYIDHTENVLDEGDGARDCQHCQYKHLLRAHGAAPAARLVGLEDLIKLQINLCCRVIKALQLISSA